MNVCLHLKGWQLSALSEKITKLSLGILVRTPWEITKSIEFLRMTGTDPPP